MTTLHQADNHWFSSALLSCLDGFFDWSLLSGKITLSASLKARLKYNRDDLGGDNKNFFIDHLHKTERDRVLKEFSSFFTSSKGEFLSEFQLKLKDGTFRWFRLQGRAQRDEKGKCFRFAGAFFDIQDYKKHLNQSLQSSDAKSKFIATLNHELRSPLAAIISMAHMMSDEPLSTKQGRYVENILDSANLLLTLVNDILDVSKIIAGKLEIEQTPFDFQNLMTSIIEMSKIAATQKGLYFKLSFDEKTPKTLIGDSTRLKQILLNLFTNAIKFTKAGGIHVTTRYICAGETQGKIYVEVTDTGIGIPDDKIDMIFKDFTQTDVSTSRQYGGTGLGLAICKKLVELMEGTIDVKSRIDVGSTFFFEIPFQTGITGDTKVAYLEPFSDTRQKASLGSSTTISSQRTDSFSRHSQGNHSSFKTPSKFGLKILVAEDNRVNQEVMIGLLETLGHEVVIAENGKLAVDLCKKDDFDMILMDINMPIMDGVEACLAIRKQNKTIPIVAVTANGLEAERHRCFEAGMTDFVTKPMDKHKLKDILEPYIAQKASSGTINAFTIKHTSSHEGGSINSEIYVNHETFRQLINDLGEVKIKKFLNLYKQDAPILIENLKKGTQEEHAAHTLAGMSENLSFVALGQKARMILQMVREKEGKEDLKAFIEELSGLYTSTMRAADILLP